MKLIKKLRMLLKGILPKAYNTEYNAGASWPLDEKNISLFKSVFFVFFWWKILIHTIKSIALIDVPKCPEPAYLIIDRVFNLQIEDIICALI